MTPELRLGVIELGNPLAETPPLLAGLRERGVDVFVRSPEPQSFRAQAERLANADCDGVMLTMSEGAGTEDAAEVLLQLSCPVLLVGETPELYAGVRDIPAEIAATVFTLAVVSEAIWPDQATPQWIGVWLRHNSRLHRRQGAEAARRLRGVRLFGSTADTVEEPATTARENATQHFFTQKKWLEQFGVLLSESDVPDQPRADDIHATDGDALGALTRRLLEMVSGSPEVESVPPSLLRRQSPAPEAPTFTLVLLSTYGTHRGSRLSRKFSGRVICAGRERDGSYPIGRYPFGFLRTDNEDHGRRLFAAAGDHTGAMYAALQALGVPTIILRDDFVREA